MPALPRGASPTLALAVALAAVGVGVGIGELARRWHARRAPVLTLFRHPTKGKAVRFSTILIVLVLVALGTEGPLADAAQSLISSVAQAISAAA